VDVAAPGVRLLAPILGNQYELWDGTSVATPFGSGTAALVMAAHPQFTTSQVKAAILNGADPVSSLSGWVVRGRLNTAKAVGSPLAQPPPPPVITKIIAGPGGVTLTWTESGAADGFDFERQVNGGAWMPAPPAAPVNGGSRTAPFNGLQAGATYAFRMRAFNSAGESGYSNTVAAQIPGLPPVLASLTANPSSLRGGKVVKFTVTLTSPAPAPGGAPVPLISSNGLAVPVPAIARVPANKVAVPITVTTRKVRKVTPVTVTASYGGVTKSVGITITP